MSFGTRESVCYLPAVGRRACVGQRDMDLLDFKKISENIFI